MNETTKAWVSQPAGDWMVLVLVVGAGDRNSSEHCQGTLVQGIKGSHGALPELETHAQVYPTFAQMLAWLQAPVTLKGTKWSGMKNLLKNPFLPPSLFSVHRCSCSHLTYCDLI